MPTAPASRALTKADLDHYQDQGYIILRGAFFPRRVAELRDGVQRIVDNALAGKCEIRWLDKANRIPARIGGMLGATYYQPAFARWLDEDLHPLIETLIGGTPRHSLFGMLAGGAGQPYLQNWHRDIGKPGAPDEVPFLRHHHGRFVQFNAPLLPHDRFLNIVPASHLRASTPEEIAVSKREGFKRKDETKPVTPDEVKQIEAWDRQQPMPGGIVVEMEPGDIAFYNANLWHRGWNTAGAMRWTMHSAFWKTDYQVMAHEANQREELTRDGQLDKYPPITRQYVQRYLDCYPSGTPKSLLEV